MPSYNGLNRRHRCPDDDWPLMSFELGIRDVRRPYKEIASAMNCAHVAHQPLRVLTVV